VEPGKGIQFAGAARYPGPSSRRTEVTSAYAGEMAWRENNRRISNGEQYLAITNAAVANGVSASWKRYWKHPLGAYPWSFLLTPAGPA
jgi:hypothetical protein